jgi:saccharopine dehydrogenase (NAD+, L-lysine-forming)
VKCDAIAASVKNRFGVDIETAQLNAMDVAATVKLVRIS